jgi:hypothetical protein
VGRINLGRPRKIRRKIQLDWDGQGLLTISSDKNNQRNIAVLVNEVEYALDFDADGRAEMEFEKSSDEVFYHVRLKDESAINADRLGFFY